MTKNYFGGEVKMRRKWCWFIAVFFIPAIWAAAALAADDVVRIGIMQFESKAYGVSAQEADAIRDIFTRHLANSRTIAVVEREQLLKIGEELRIGLSGLVDPSTAAKVGKIAGCRYMLFGSVTKLEEKERHDEFIVPTNIFHGVPPIRSRKVKKEATAGIDVRLVDVETAVIVRSLYEEGMVSEEDSNVALPGLYRGIEKTLGGLKSRAIEKAVSLLAKEILELYGRSNIGRSPEPPAYKDTPEKPVDRPVSPPGDRSKFPENPRPPVDDRSQPGTGPGSQPGRGNYKWIEADGVDRNSETGVKLIEIYPLFPDEKSDLRIRHSGAYTLYTKNKHKEAFEVFSSLATEYSCNYLSAYWAGICASRLGSSKEAEKWFDFALSINPEYKPALAEKYTLSRGGKKP
jgi:curli biogenesis system outer membrane secretion channel CsgG